MKKTRQLLCILLSVIISLPANIPVYAEEKMSLEDKITYASRLLGQVMDDQYEECVTEIKKKISEEGHNYTYSMESFLDMGDPFKDVDYIGLLATYSAIKSKLAKEGREVTTSLKSIKYITYTAEVENYGENEPYKIDEYNAVDEEAGLYERTGYRYSDEEEEVPVFEEVEDGLYKMVGTKTVTPEKSDGTYLEITMKAFDIEDLFEIMGVEKDEELTEDIERRRKILETAGDNDAIRAGMVAHLPDRMVDMDSWNRDFLDKIGYTDDETPIRITGEKVAAIASLLEGQVPYEWGGKSSKPGYDNTWWTYNYDTKLQKGLDCSGFVQWTYRTAGFGEDITQTLLSTHIMDRTYEAIDRKDIRPGDIGLNMTRKIGHCGIYAGNGKWWHCSSSSGTVTLEDGTGLGFHKIIRPVDLEENYFYRKIRTYDEKDLGETVQEEQDVQEAQEEQELRKKREEELKKAKEAEDAAKKEVEEAAIKAAEEAKKVEEEIRKAEEAKKAAEEELRKAEEAKKAAEQAKAEEEAKKAAEEIRKAEERMKEAARQAEAERLAIQKKLAEAKAETERIAAEQAKAMTAESIVVTNTNSTSAVSDSDVMLLAQLMHHEALNQGPNGWIAVGEVVTNRIKSPLFPNDLRSVIFQNGQFTKASAITSIKPDEEMLKAARGVLEGRLSVLGNTGVLYFRNAGSNTGSWGKHAVYRKLGQHTFYVQ